MSSQPALKPPVALSGLYTLSIGEYYHEQCLKEIKAQLQALHGVSLNKSSTQNSLMYTCPNQKSCNREKESKNIYRSQANAPSNTPKPKTNLSLGLSLRQRDKQIIDVPKLHCSYFIKFLMRRSHQRTLYYLEDFSFDHLPECFDEAQAQFLKINLNLSQITSAIQKIVSRKKARKQQQNNPKAVHDVLCSEYNLSRNFFGQNLLQVHRRKLKKKFDNIIADSKRYPLDIKEVLTSQQYAKHYSDTKTTNQHSISIKKSKIGQQKRSILIEEEFEQQSSSQSLDDNKEYIPSKQISAKRKSRINPLKKQNSKPIQGKVRRNIRKFNQKQQSSLHKNKSQVDYEFEANEKPIKRNKNSITESWQKSQPQNQVEQIQKQRYYDHQINNQGKFQPNDLSTPFKKFNQDQLIKFSSTNRMKQTQSDINQVYPQKAFRYNLQQHQAMEIEEAQPQNSQMDEEQQFSSSDYSVERFYDDQNKAKTLYRLKRFKNGKDRKKKSNQEQFLDKTKKISKNRSEKKARQSNQVCREKNDQKTSSKEKGKL